MTIGARSRGIDEIALQFLVFGRVQGVGFRESTLRQALAIGEVRGFVRNRRDGTVEVQAVGPADCLARLRAFLAVGPPIARVDRLFEEPLADPPAENTFRIMR